MPGSGSGSGETGRSKDRNRAPGRLHQLRPTPAPAAAPAPRPAPLRSRRRARHRAGRDHGRRPSPAPSRTAAVAQRLLDGRGRLQVLGGARRRTRRRPRAARALEHAPRPGTRQAPPSHQGRCGASVGQPRTSSRRAPGAGTTGGRRPPGPRATAPGWAPAPAMEWRRASSRLPPYGPPPAAPTTYVDARLCPQAIRGQLQEVGNPAREHLRPVRVDHRAVMRGLAGIRPRPELGHPSLPCRPADWSLQTTTPTCPYEAILVRSSP
ncbi:hypothetical protein SCANM63S_00882 [Streptomyces canarius]